MTRRARERLEDVRGALDHIRAHAGGSLERPAIDSPLALHAVLFNLIVIGEAIKNVDADLREAAPEVPWSDYAGLRDVIAHQYFRIQGQLVEETVGRDLPALRAAVERLLASSRI